MADKKISALTGATTPLAGTEVLPIVQGGSTVKVSIADVTAGRAVSASSLSLTATPLGVASGGTGAATLTSGYVVKGNGTSAVSASIAYDTGVNLGLGTITPNRKLTIATTGGDPTNGLGIQFDGSEVASFTSNASTGEIRVGSTGIGSFFLTFYSVNAERMRIDTSGNITATTGNIVIGTTAKGLTTGSAIPLGFGVNNTVTAITIDTASNVGVGTASPSAKFNVVNTGLNSRIAIGDTAANTYSTLLMYGGSGRFNFQLSVQNNVSDAFEITPSTAAEGTTFSTPAVVINSSSNVGIGTNSPAATAILDVQSTTKGVRFPNMTTTQKNAITPSAGTVIFDTTLAKLCVYSGSAWQTITSI